MIEQANGTVKVRLRSWKQDHNTEEWVIALPATAPAMNQPVDGSARMMPHEAVFRRKPRRGDNSLVSPDEAEKFTLTDVVEEMRDLSEPNGDEFCRMEDFVEPYRFDSYSGLLPVANDANPGSLILSNLRSQSPVSDSESSVSSLNSAFSLDLALLTPAERALQIRAAHSRELL